MAQYYGVQRSDEYLAHYGIRGMKWGVRKALERGDRAALSRHYQRASAKLAKLTKDHPSAKSRIGRTAAGGLRVDLRTNKQRANDSGVHISYSKSKHSNSKILYKAAQKAGHKLEEAEAVRNKSFLGRHGFGKTQRAVNNARRVANDSFDAYYNSLDKKRQAKLRRKWVG